MPTANKHDIIRERRLRQKLARVEAENKPRTTPSWFKHARCPLCLERYVVNNNRRREVRPHRLLGVAICPNCYYKQGAERLVRIYKLGKRMAQAEVSSETHRYIIFDLDINALVQEAKEIFS